jgi:hypothetical protein
MKKMNLLLDIDVASIVGLVILAIAIVGGVFLAIKLNKKVDKNIENVNWDKLNTKGMHKKHTPVLWPKELEFYEMFKSILPKQYMIIPKMGVDEIVKPNGNLLLFNAIKTEHVDFCIVKVSNMEPVVVLDTYYPSISDSTIQELPVAVKKALESVNIPVIKYEILDVPYDKDAILKQFLDAIDPVSLAQLRNQK